MFEATSSCKEEIIQSRKKDAENGMSSCIARMVAGKEQLEFTSGWKSFHISEVMDGGGFATLLRGQIQTPSFKQVSSPVHLPLRVCSVLTCPASTAQSKPAGGSLVLLHAGMRSPPTPCVAAVAGCRSQDSRGHGYGP